MDGLDRMFAQISDLAARMKEDVPLTHPAEPALNLEQKVDRIHDAISHLLTLTDKLVAEVGGLKQEVSGLKDRVTALEIHTDTGFQVIAARLDEQRQTINAMIPTRIAAVGRPDVA